MTADEIYRIWAPHESIWSPWVKPVLFSHMGPSAPHLVVPPVDVSWTNLADGSTAMIADLPAAEGVAMGMSLAAIGYRPIPLYNACPEGPAQLSLVEVRPILLALSAAAVALKELGIAQDAPPVFLLDASRGHRRIECAPGVLDNRSISLPSDFPSAHLLLSRGIRRILLVQNSARAPQADLSHTLRRWQEAGLVMLSKDVTRSELAHSILVARPNGFRAIFHNLLATIGLKTSPLGGFGGVLPMPSSG